jgi:hypothetical protein
MASRLRLGWLRGARRFEETADERSAGDWFIVACPRVAKPFDEGEQGAAYPATYTAAMVNLALELISITPFYGARTRVGIAHGPAAGAVIGTLRAFYCLYGDTVNTAARMCKNAPAGHIYCTEAVSTLVLEAGEACPGIGSYDRGVKDVKGKGPMQLFELGYLEKDVHMPARTRSSLASSRDLHDIVIDFKAVASESQARWIADPAREIARPLCRFADPSLEAAFQGAAEAGQRRLLTSGLVLNALATALEWRMGGMTAPLAVHWGVSWAVCAALLLLLWWGGIGRAACSRLFGLQLVAHLCLATVASRGVETTGAHWSWVLVFITGMCIVTAWMGQPSVRNAAALGTVALTTFFVGLSAHPFIAPRATDVALIMALAIGMVRLPHHLPH